MGFKEKHIFGKAGVKDLILGLFFLFLAFVAMFLYYGILLGQFTDLEGETVVLNDPENFPNLMLAIFFLFTGCGATGGYHLGRYIEVEFAKRRKQTTLVK